MKNLFFFLFLVVLFLSPSRSLFSQTPSAPSLQLEVLYTGLSTNSGIYNCGDHRLFIVERTDGDIEIIDTLGNYIGKFLDMTGLISTGSERGLLGLTFHPNYAENGYFYINYTNVQGNTVIARYTVSSSNANQANPASAQIILTQTQPYTNHNGGDLAFGADGYLYIGLGDGGNGGDPLNYGQNEGTLLGKMLRIDVDSAFPYAIPPDNPYVGAQDSLPEIWDTGLRNPWRFSFDRETGDLWIADVGQNNWEEVNFEPAGTGNKNYGWRCYEGNVVMNPVACDFSPEFTFPIAVYNHSQTGFCAIIGGYVYRGQKFPQLEGHYILTDYCAGQLRSIKRLPDGSVELYTLNAGPGFGNVAMGEDASGELYVCNYTQGTIYRVTNACSTFSPTIASAGNGQLTTTSGSAVWWWKDGELLPNATGTSYTPTESGLYTATVSNTSGCTVRSNAVQWLVNSGIPGCTYPSAINYNPAAEADDGSCLFGLLGCTYSAAVNYNPQAVLDDGSCVFGPFGCTYSNAINFDAQAVLDDGSCTFPFSIDCPLDLDGDGLVGIGDLVLFISAYGTLCD